jgi:hypothetical protein
MIWSKRHVTNQWCHVAAGWIDRWICIRIADLNNASQTFKSRATTLKRRMWWQNCKLWLVLGGGELCNRTIILIHTHFSSSISPTLVVAIIIVIIIIAVCANTGACSSGGSSDSTTTTAAPGTSAPAAAQFIQHMVDALQPLQQLQQ